VRAALAPDQVLACGDFLNGQRFAGTATADRAAALVVEVHLNTVVHAGDDDVARVLG
jgi:hypothetical protein